MNERLSGSHSVSANSSSRGSRRTRPPPQPGQCGLHPQSHAPPPLRASLHARHQRQIDPPTQEVLRPPRWRLATHHAAQSVQQPEPSKSVTGRNGPSWNRKRAPKGSLRWRKVLQAYQACLPARRRVVRPRPTKAMPSSARVAGSGTRETSVPVLDANTRV